MNTPGTIAGPDVAQSERVAEANKIDAALDTLEEKIEKTLDPDILDDLYRELEKLVWTIEDQYLEIDD
jgi:hypothetical protein